AQRREVALADVADFRSRTGRGIAGTVRGKRVVVGNRDALTEEGIDAVRLAEAAESRTSSGETVLFVGVDGALAGLVSVADRLKRGAAEAVAALRAAGIDVRLATGDSRRTAEAVARSVGIPLFQ